ncbi:MAG: hypothetical protein HND57_16690 [Planctomycetes bacterium]|nr:hypothetical protein [Planctomycetota bacterium]
MKQYLALLALGTVAGIASADVITVHTDRVAYEAAAGVPQIVEDFTPSSHFPLVSGVLNSLTTDAGLLPGDIEEGVTYSTPVGDGNFFNIDGGGGYAGGFLDGFNPSDRDVTIVFHNSDPNDLRTVNGFGFDLSGVLGATDLDVTISFSTGPDQNFNVPYMATFYGFTSDQRDITGVVVSNNNSFFGFDFDNFTYDEIGAGLTLEVVSACPNGGQATLTATGGQGGNVAFIYAYGTGSVIIPGGNPCVGTQLGLNGTAKLAGTAPGNPAVLVANAPKAGCGRVWVQALDLVDCSTSNVVKYE